jgi:hypothetical protein
MPARLSSRLGKPTPNVKACRQELLLRGLVFEDVEHARSGRDRVGRQFGLQVCPQLGLRVVFLECPARREHAIGETWLLLVRRCELDLRGDHQQLVAQLPCRSNRGGPFSGVLDDVDHIAEVHHVGRTLLAAGSMRWIPPVAVDPRSAQKFDVLAVPAPVPA